MNQKSSSRYPYIFLIFLITILSVLPAYFTWNRVIIGGDNTIPFNSEALTKYLTQWIGVQNGSYFSVNFYPLFFFYKFAEMFGLSYYGISALLLFILNFVAGIGIFKLTRLYYKGDYPYLFIVPILFYLLSPALLNAWHYLYIYSFTPWFVYLILDFIKKKKIKISNLIWLNIVIFFASLDLPNPKYIFYLIIIATIIVFLSYLLKLIDNYFLWKTICAFITSLLLSSYLLLPLFNFAIHYSPSTYGVSVNPNNGSWGNMLDSGTATINKMFNLHHGGININKEESQSYLRNPLVTLFSYFYISIILLDILLKNKQIKKEDRGHKLILLSLIIVFLSLSTGPNPPLGFLYIYFVNKLQPLAFLRTTAGSVFMLSVFYSVYIFILIQQKNKFSNILRVLILPAILITGYPILFGDFYENNTRINQYTANNQRGFELPQEYFLVSSIMNLQKIDAKVNFLGSDSSYINTKWGYFGPPIYSLIYAKTPIYEKTVLVNESYHNIGFSYLDESIIGQAQKPDLSKNTELFNSGNVKFYKVTDSHFLPHVYTPLAINNGTESGQLRTATYRQGDWQGNDKIDKNPTLEYKKINETKYRVKVHGAKSNFPLIFLETFNNGWEVYIQTPKINKILNKDNYKILDGNVDSQASSDEIIDFIKRGYLTDLGDGKYKEIVHKKWENNQLKNDYLEKYTIDFISKNYQGTIQNNNLANGTPFETWFKKPIESSSHKIVNGYANSWRIDLEKFCNKANCIKNGDGSYDFELIIEFAPQKVFYLGVIISLTTLLGLIGYSVYNKKLE